LTLLFVVAGLWLALGARFVGGVWVVAGHSMQPTLEPGDWVLVDRWTFRHRAPRAGEVVLLLVPDSPAPAVKRVTRAVPAGNAFEVRGDNPAVSLDSRTFGAVPAGSILGRVAWRLQPR
jgi:nickel-type superoxide dismutase maturation protease